jgi:Transglycosylase SLT domain
VRRAQRSSIVAIVLAIGVCGTFVAVLVLGLPIVSIGTSVRSVSASASYQVRVSAFARIEIPPEYLRLYIAAAQRYGLDWSILAGIGRVECDDGRDPSPSCSTEGVENSAGAGGPMQFLASTWARYGVDAYGDGAPDRWDAADAIFSAANYLRACGAPADYRAAIFAYNHAWWYVEEVESWARRYRGARGEAGAGPDVAGAGELGAGELGAGESGWGREFGPAASSTPVLYVAGSEAKLLRGDGHVALIPEEAPPAVQAMVIAGNELQELPYGPAGHPDPLGASSEDCSSTVNYVLYKAGVRSLAEILSSNPLAQDYVHWGDPGPGRWVTIYATDLPQPHVFVTIAGLRLDTSYQGTDEGPNRDEGGPRWRLLPYIPTWAHWSVRHPPGL